MSILATPVAGGDNRRVPPRVSSPEFVGRAAELARLEAALERAERGSAAAAFVAGESGVGKTRLLRELERRAVERGTRVLRGDCVAFGAGELAYAPLAAALRRLARELDPAVLDELLGGARDELARLAPELSPTPLGGARAGRERRRGACPGPPVRAPARPARPAGRRVARAVRHRGPALGRPLHARVRVVAARWAARRAPAADVHLSQRRASSPPSAAPVPGRGGAPRAGGAHRAPAVLAGGARGAGRRDPRQRRRTGARRAPVRALRGQCVLRRGAACRLRRRNRPPASHPARRPEPAPGGAATRRTRGAARGSDGRPAGGPSAARHRHRPARARAPGRAAGGGRPPRARTRQRWLRLPPRPAGGGRLCRPAPGRADRAAPGARRGPERRSEPRRRRSRRRARTPLARRTPHARGARRLRGRGVGGRAHLRLRGSGTALRAGARGLGPRRGRRRALGARPRGRRGPRGAERARLRRASPCGHSRAQSAGARRWHRRRGLPGART